jgi:hypothetical protein
MCLLVTIGGRDLVVLPGGKVMVEQRHGEAQVYELGERLQPGATPATPSPPASSRQSSSKEKFATSGQQAISITI